MEFTMEYTRGAVPLSRAALRNRVRSRYTLQVQLGLAGHYFPGLKRAQIPITTGHWFQSRRDSRVTLTVAVRPPLAAFPGVWHRRYLGSGTAYVQKYKATARILLL